MMVHSYWEIEFRFCIIGTGGLVCGLSGLLVWARGLFSVGGIGPRNL